MGMLFVFLMFVVPAVIALKGMFGDNFMDILKGEGEDRVKYVRVAETPAPTPAPAKVASRAKAKAAPATPAAPADS